MFGNNGLNIVEYDQVSFLAELGVVFLLFAIGLELSIERLKAMRKYVFGLGLLQVMLTSTIIAIIAFLVVKDYASALVIAGGLALSSTAIVLQVLKDTNNSQMQVGRMALSILILQDLIVVPMLVITPLLGIDSSISGEIIQSSISSVIFMSLLKAVGTLIVIFVTGRLILRPLFSFIIPDNASGNEIPIAMTLLIVLSVSTATEEFGLSSALGAFAAGVLVAETDFRKKAEESIYPFKSLLLGLFFMSVGMNIDVIEIYSLKYTIFSYCMILIIVKATIIILLCLLFGLNKSVAIHTGLLLSQGGEFAFILFGLAQTVGVIQTKTANILLLVVTCSMAITPLLAKIGEIISEKISHSLGKTPEQILSLGASDLSNHIIIGGFGKIGKMTAAMLKSKDISYIVLDMNVEKVKKHSKNGVPIFRGDISSLKHLKAVGIESSMGVVLTMRNDITMKKSCKTVNGYVNDLPIIMSKRDLKHPNDIYNNENIRIIPESYETGMEIGGIILKIFGSNNSDISRIKQKIRDLKYDVDSNTIKYSEIEHGKS
ncbi:MAG TPA: cation:proton antiporter [Candidatus Megaira endosymbiont of Hartmannula sinica]|nr:cation:proton antiporter [Candidatus Megaera endosymbiont of Hartmannula sinica]